MPEITAKLVNELRARTGQGMMECKRALTETGGDLEKAIEGRVVGVEAEDHKAAALVEINCNTDFTAKSEPFLKLGAEAARLLLHNPNVDIAHAANVNANITAVAQTTGENVRIGKTARLEAPAAGRAGLYLYGITGKIGVIMAFTGNPSEELVKQIGGHIAFARPLGLTRDAVPAGLVAEEEEFAV